MQSKRKRLALRRRQVGLSQEALAQALKVERTTVARWESGHTTPHPLHRPRLAEVLGVAVDELDGLLGTGTGEAGGPLTGTRLAICGSRAPGTDGPLIDAIVMELARVVATRPDVAVSHGPVGVGIEVVTCVADHYHPPGFAMTPALFGRANVVSGAHLVLVIGGGPGTTAEVAIAERIGLPVLPFPGSGGAARATFERMRSGPGEMYDFVAPLETCVDAVAYGRLVEHILNEKAGFPA